MDGVVGGDDPEGNKDEETGTADAGGAGRDDPGREPDEVQHKAWRGDRGKPGMMTRPEGATWRGNDDKVTG